MTTRITRLEDQLSQRMVLKLEGTLTVADARILEEICNDLQEESNCDITIDLTGVDFIGHQSAAILCRLKEKPDLKLEGMHLFVQQIMDSVEAAHRNAREGEVQ